MEGVRKEMAPGHAWSFYGEFIPGMETMNTTLASPPPNNTAKKQKNPKKQNNPTKQNSRLDL